MLHLFYKDTLIEELPKDLGSPKTEVPSKFKDVIFNQLSSDEKKLVVSQLIVKIVVFEDAIIRGIYSLLLLKSFNILALDLTRTFVLALIKLRYGIKKEYQTLICYPLLIRYMQDSESNLIQIMLIFFINKFS